jgi:hypothetical protein
LVAQLTQNFHRAATLFVNDSRGFTKILSSLRLLSKGLAKWSQPKFRQPGR